LKKTLQRLKVYLTEVLGIQVKIQSWTKGASLPFFLRDSYDFYEIPLMKISSLLLVAKEDLELTPATIKKHFEQIQKCAVYLF